MRRLECVRAAARLSKSTRARQLLILIMGARARHQFPTWPRARRFVAPLDTSFARRK